MRATTILRQLLGVTNLVVEDVVVDDNDDVLLHVRPTWKKARCSGCERRAPRYDQRPLRIWRHLGWGRKSVYFLYAPRRVNCPTCGVVSELVPWAAARSRFTYEFEEYAGYLAQVTDKTRVTELVGIAWRTVGAIVERVVARNLDCARLDNLRSIGVDEFSYRKKHRYLTIVVDHDTKRVVWAKEGKSADTLRAFFEALGPERSAGIENVTIDMSAAYIEAVTDSAPNAKIVFDRFHVEKLASEALDEVRRTLVRELKASGDEVARKSIKRTRFLLLKRPSKLSQREKRRLSAIQGTNQKLYRGYLLKESLGAALDYVQPKRAKDALAEWLSWASRSKLKPFVKAARTIRKFRDGVLAYTQTKLTNGLAEGLNNKTRMITRRAYGFHSPDALMAMIFLCCGGIQLDPPLP